jgi:hypothetical protein
VTLQLPVRHRCRYCYCILGWLWGLIGCSWGLWLGQEFETEGSSLAMELGTGLEGKVCHDMTFQGLELLISSGPMSEACGKPAVVPPALALHPAYLPG